MTSETYWYRLLSTGTVGLFSTVLALAIYEYSVLKAHIKSLLMRRTQVLVKYEDNFKNTVANW